MSSKINIAIVGTVRNVAKTIINNFNYIESALKNFSLYWYIVESDSSDTTVKELRKLKNSHINFNFLSLGKLEHKFKRKTVRLAFCRNKYLNYVRKKKFKYMIVADLDLKFDSLDERIFKKCFKKKNWSVLTANCNGPYYDIGALRHKIWSPNDATEQWKFYNLFSKDFVGNSIRSIQSRMITIHKSMSWIEVNSAFNGMAIYKVSDIKKSFYIGLENNKEICEHVLFHKNIVKKKKKIFINPELLFSKDKFNEHTIKTTKSRRVLSYLNMLVNNKK